MTQTLISGTGYELRHGSEDLASLRGERNAAVETISAISAGQGEGTSIARGASRGVPQGKRSKHTHSARPGVSEKCQDMEVNVLGGKQERRHIDSWGNSYRAG